MANDIFGPNVSSTNPLKTLNGKLGNGCVFGAAKTKGTKARIMHSLVINEQAVTMEVKRIKRENNVHMKVKAREPRDTANL